MEAQTIQSNPNLSTLIASGRELLETAEAAALLRFKPQTLRRWACYGKGPILPIRVSDKLRWRVSDIARLMNGEAA